MTKRDPDPIMVTCDVCGGSFQADPHRYDIRRNTTYDIMVCSGCRDANWDGWAPHLAPKVTKRLLEQGRILPERNAKGFLPWASLKRCTGY